MSVEMRLLVWATALTLVQALIAALGAQLQVGVPALAGNREHLPPIEGWAGRAQRADFRTAGFTSEQHFVSSALQALCEEPDLRGFAAAFAAFK